MPRVLKRTEINAKDGRRDFRTQIAIANSLLHSPVQTTPTPEQTEPKQDVVSIQALHDLVTSIERVGEAIQNDASLSVLNEIKNSIAEIAKRKTVVVGLTVKSRDKDGYIKDVEVITK